MRLFFTNRAILNQINQLGKERGKYFCGVVFFNRFLGAALADPITSKLIPSIKLINKNKKKK